MLNTSSKRLASVVAFVASGLVVILALSLFFNRQAIADQVVVWFYSPTASVASINGRLDLTQQGQRIFYATQPEVANQDLFNSSCPRQEVGSPILGCYTPSDRIYIYDVTNKQLDGIEEVTAAHELLHAVWMRMSDNERNRVGEQLEAAYNALQDNDLKERMAYYQRTEPGEFHNELHSILGTEFSNLGSELEKHYSNYFADREKILALHRQYDTLYDTLESKALALYAEIETLSQSLHASMTDYDNNMSQLEKDIASFNERAARGGFSSTAQFNSERSSLLARANALERDRVSINASVARYNQLYDEYQQVASQIDILNKSLDSFQVVSGPSVGV